MYYEVVRYQYNKCPLSIQRIKYPTAKNLIAIVLRTWYDVWTRDCLNVDRGGLEGLKGNEESPKIDIIHVQIIHLQTLETEIVHSLIEIILQQKHKLRGNVSSK